MLWEIEMTNPLMRAAIIGVSGRLGRAIAYQLMVGPQTELSAGIVASSSQYLDADIGELIGLGFKDIEASVSFDDAFAKSDVVIDASQPIATVAVAERLSEYGKIGLVTGTTGLDETQQARLEAAAKSIPVLQASNFSVGVAIVERLVSEASRLLDPQLYDLEIIEAHHRFKADAPSGTALTLGRAAAKARNVDFDHAAVYERPRQGEPRKTGEIGFHAVRGGGVIGDHSAQFLNDLEQITVQHTAFDRTIFARGAVMASRWLKDKPAGLYSMQDLIGSPD
jgi:4-hydroxy-tetrahydrodipicolinate reductase